MTKEQKSNQVIALYYPSDCLPRTLGKRKLTFKAATKRKKVKRKTFYQKSLK